MKKRQKAARQKEMLFPIEGKKPTKKARLGGRRQELAPERHRLLSNTIFSKSVPSRISEEGARCEMTPLRVKMWSFWSCGPPVRNSR